MRSLKIIALLSSMFVLMVVASLQAQTLIPADSAVSDTLIVLMEDVSLAEMQVEEAIAAPIPSTRAEQKQRLRKIYEARTALAKTEQEYFAFCSNHAPDIDTRTLFTRKAWRAKREADHYQGQVYAYIDAEYPRIQR